MDGRERANALCGLVEPPHGAAFRGTAMSLPATGTWAPAVPGLARVHFAPARLSG
jgi:hypothetical protein